MKNLFSVLILLIATNGICQLPITPFEEVTFTPKFYDWSKTMNHQESINDISDGYHNFNSIIDGHIVDDNLYVLFDRFTGFGPNWRDLDGAILRRYDLATCSLDWEREFGVDTDGKQEHIQNFYIDDDMLVLNGLRKVEDMVLNQFPPYALGAHDQRMVHRRIQLDDGSISKQLIGDSLQSPNIEGSYFSRRSQLFPLANGNYMLVQVDLNGIKFTSINPDGTLSNEDQRLNPYFQPNFAFFKSDEGFINVFPSTGDRNVHIARFDENMNVVDTLRSIFIDSTMKAADYRPSTYQNGYIKVENTNRSDTGRNIYFIDDEANFIAQHRVETYHGSAFYLPQQEIVLTTDVRSELVGSEVKRYLLFSLKSSDGTIAASQHEISDPDRLLIIDKVFPYGNELIMVGINRAYDESNTLNSGFDRNARAMTIMKASLFDLGLVNDTQESVTNTNVRVYPTSVVDHTTLHFDHSFFGKALLYNASGQLIAVEDLQNTITQKVDLSNCASGYHSIIVLNEKGRMTSQHKVLKI